jgi:hypothetical protein
MLALMHLNQLLSLDVPLTSLYLSTTLGVEDKSMKHSGFTPGPWRVENSWNEPGGGRLSVTASLGKQERSIIVMRPGNLNGGESEYAGPWQAEPTPPARAVSCSLSEIVDDAIELLSFIDQPNYSTVLYTIEAKENV